MTARVVLAVNPSAGRGRGARAGAVVTDLLRREGFDVLPVRASGLSDLVVRVRSAVRDGADALVTVGGDGMVHLGVNVVAGTPTPLGIVAAGTGNDIARGLGLPVADARAAARSLVSALRSGTVRTVDAARCPGAGDLTRPAGSPELRPGPGTPGGPAPVGPEGPDRPASEGPGYGPALPRGDRWFAGVLGAGFDALVNERANGWTRPAGHLRYDLAILRELPVLRARTYLLELDGRMLPTEAVLVVVANGPAYGGGMKVCPDARMDDGLLDVLLLAPLSRTAFLRLYPKVYAGTHLDDPRVTVHRAAHVTVTSPGIVAYADGERLAPLPITARVVPGALRVLVP